MRRELDALLSVQRFISGVLPEPWDVRRVLEPGDRPARPFALVEQIAGAETTGAPATQDVVVPITVSMYLARADSRRAAADAALELREQVWQAVKWGMDARRATTDRIPLFAYDPREERHRFKLVGATGGTVAVGVGAHTTGALPVDATAGMVAAAIATTLAADPADVVGVDRGVGAWEIVYTGGLAGTRPGLPSIDISSVVGPGAAGSAAVLLEGAAAPWRGPSDWLRVESFSQNTVHDQVDPALVMVAVDLRVRFARGLPAWPGRTLQRVAGTAVIA